VTPDELRAALAAALVDMYGDALSDRQEFLREADVLLPVIRAYAAAQLRAAAEDVQRHAVDVGHAGALLHAIAGEEEGRAHRG
jgi:hypothetical protein